MAYAAAGWSYDETTTLRPPQWLGMLKLMGGSGSLTYVPGYFTIPSAHGSSCVWGVCNDAPCGSNATCLQQTIQNPNHHLWQELMPPYAQASISRGEDIIRSPSAVWLGELPTSTPAAPATGYRLGSRVLLVTALMPGGNDAAQYLKSRGRPRVPPPGARRPG